MSNEKQSASKLALADTLEKAARQLRETGSVSATNVCDKNKSVDERRATIALALGILADFQTGGDLPDNLILLIAHERKKAGEDAEVENQILSYGDLNGLKRLSAEGHRELGKQLQGVILDEVLTNILARRAQKGGEADA